MAPEPVLTLSMSGSSIDCDNASVKDEQDLDSDAILQKQNIKCNDYWEWNGEDSSREVSIHGDDNRRAVTFHPHWSNGTAGIRARRHLVGSLSYWEIHVGDRVFGTSLMFGVSTKKARLHANEFKNLLGEDEHGWGLSHRGRLYHNGESTYYCKPFQEYTPVIVGVLVNRIKGEITFFKDGVSLGVAFTGLDQTEDDLYPTICSTAAKTAMMVGRRFRSFTDLQDRCRQVIASSIIKSSCEKGLEKEVVGMLPLPNKMKHYIYWGIDELRPNVWY